MPDGPTAARHEAAPGPLPGRAGKDRTRPGPLRRPLTVAVAVAATLAPLLAAGCGDTPVTLSKAQLAARVQPGMVTVTSALGYQGGLSAGTGIVLTSSGEVLTNNHVIQGATSIKVSDIGDGRSYPAVVVGYDLRHDIAVLRLRGASGLKTAPLGDSAGLTIGDKVVAFGNADGSGSPASAEGRVTGLGETIVATNESSGTSERLTGMIRTSVAIKAGFSGGPLVDVAGEVVGVNTAGSATAPPPSRKARFEAFAVPINQAKSSARQIEAGRSSASVHVGPTAFLGVALRNSPGRATAGAEVARVQPSSPAAGAGLTAGAVITSIGGRAVSSPSDIQAVLVTRHPGDRISVTWTDMSGRSHAVTVILAAGPAA